MITLKELVENQKWNKMTDIEVIKTFFDLNNLEEEGMDLIHELTRTKIKKLKEKHRMSEEWASYLPSKYLYENYDLDTANNLHALEINYLVNDGELSCGFLKWANENIPSIVRPQVYFNPLVEWLENEGIRFKER